MHNSVKVTKQWGQFNVTVESFVPDSLVGELVNLGFLHLVERSPSSAVEQTVIAPLQGWEKNKKGQGYKRPASFKRTDVEYSEDLAAKIKTAFEDAGCKVDAANSLKLKVVSITKYEGGEASPMVRATAFVDLMLASAEENMRTTFAALGMADAEDADREALITFAHAKGFGVDPKKV